MPANWKNAIENYLECYHCPTAHPSLAKVVDVDVDSYRLVEREFSSSQLPAARKAGRTTTTGQTSATRRPPS